MKQWSEGNARIAVSECNCVIEFLLVVWSMGMRCAQHAVHMPGRELK